MKTMKLSPQWRRMSKNDDCCRLSKNLKQGVDNDLNLIDGRWICSICGKTWCGNGKDQYLDHHLEIPTKLGLRFMSACDNVIADGKRLRLVNVIRSM